MFLPSFRMLIVILPSIFRFYDFTLFSKMKSPFAPTLNSVCWRGIKKLKEIRNYLKTMKKRQNYPSLSPPSWLQSASLSKPRSAKEWRRLDQPRPGLTQRQRRDPAGGQAGARPARPKSPARIQEQPLLELRPRIWPPQTAKTLQLSCKGK